MSLGPWPLVGALLENPQTLTHYFLLELNPSLNASFCIKTARLSWETPLAEAFHDPESWYEPPFLDYILVMPIGSNTVCPRSSLLKAMDSDSNDQGL